MVLTRSTASGIGAIGYSAAREQLHRVSSIFDSAESEVIGWM